MNLILKVCLILTVQTACLFPPLHPSWAAPVDSLHLHTIHLSVHCIIACPGKEREVKIQLTGGVKMSKSFLAKSFVKPGSHDIL